MTGVAQLRGSAESSRPMREAIVAFASGPHAPIDWRGKVVELEGLRGIAILMVTIHHFWPEGGGLLGEWAAVAHLGWVGVDLFFVISGFLIGGILLDTRHDERYFRNFYARRVLRIFPLYYALVLALFIAVPLAQTVLHDVQYRDTEFLRESGSPVWYLLFAGNIRESITGTEPAYLLAPLWSISIEEQFYLLCPLLVRWLDVATLRRVLIGFMVLSPLFRLAMLAAFPDNERIQYLSTIARLDNLSAGVWLAILARSGVALSSRGLSILLAALTCTAIVIFVNDGFDRTRAFCRILGYSFLALYFFVVVAWALRHRGTRVAAVLRMPWLLSLGGICYGLYILQRPAEVVLNKAFALMDMDLAQLGLLSLVAKTLFAILVAHLSFRLFEAPINRLKGRFVSERHPLMQPGGEPVHGSAALDDLPSPVRVTEPLDRECPAAQPR